MAEDLVERVAKAIALATYNQSDSGVMPKWSDFRDEARTAIEAMRDPDMAMISPNLNARGSRVLRLTVVAGSGLEPES